MRKKLLEIICCPRCGGAVDMHTEMTLGEDIWEGALTCRKCGENYAVEKGMPQLYVDDESWKPKAVEAQGWVTYHQKLGIYEQDEDSVDLHIPYYPEEPWIGVAKSFDKALEQLNLQGDEVILDLGAGRGWAAKAFALKGCEVTALDIVVDENVGLGRARVIMDDADVFFERIIADGENLPFFGDKFDVVFCAATLHHSSALPLLMSNIYRVLKPGGKLCAINEPCISIMSGEQEVLNRDAMEEMEEGINETRPNFIDYYRAISERGFTLEQAFPAESYGMDLTALSHWTRANGAIRPSFFSRSIRGSARSWSTYVKQRTDALIDRKLGEARSVIEKAGGERQKMEWAFLIWRGGELFLMAKKPMQSIVTPAA